MPSGKLTRIDCNQHYDAEVRRSQDYTWKQHGDNALEVSVVNKVTTCVPLCTARSKITTFTTETPMNIAFRAREQGARCIQLNNTSLNLHPVNT